MNHICYIVSVVGACLFFAALIIGAERARIRAGQERFAQKVLRLAHEQESDSPNKVLARRMRHPYASQYD